jgi:APA family basic amino acid/polyamine antiporter
MENNRNLSLFTAISLVVATMIGTGVFTTTGFMVKDLGSPTAILLLWLIGGIISLCGALSFAELTVLFPRNGGEYNLLSKIYSPAVGFVSGCISFIAGFGASIASSALAFGAYLKPLIDIDPRVSALSVILINAFIHSYKTETGAKFQNIFTLVKVLLIVVFIIGALFFGNYINIDNNISTSEVILSPAFATGLIFVSFAYSGWESAAYVAGEIKNPEKLIPISLISGTLIVTLLYLGLNLTYLLTVPLSQLSGVVEVGKITAEYIFGINGGLIMSAIIAFGLISSVGSMTMAGPRIYQVMGEDYPKLSFLSKKTKGNAPINAIILQTIISIIMVLSVDIDKLLQYIGFTLSLSAGLSVLGVIVMRFKDPHTPRLYRTWGYPFTPILFLSLSLWMIIYSIIDSPYVFISGAITILSSLFLYKIVKK